MARRKHIMVIQTHAALVKALREMDSKAIESGGRKIVKEVLKPYRDELHAQNAAFHKVTGRLSGTKLWRKAAKLSVPNSSVSSPGSIKGKREGRDYILGFFYIQDMQNIEKTRSRLVKDMRMAYRANTSDYSAWLNFGVRPHQLGKDSITERNVRSRQAYYVNRLTKYHQILSSGLDPRGRKLSESYRRRIEATMDRIHLRLEQLPLASQTGKMHPGISARNYITKIRSKIKSNAVSDLSNQMQAEVHKFLESKKSIFAKKE